MIVIPKPSEEVVERFKKVIGIDPDCEPESLLMSEDHYCALVIVEVGLDDFKRVLHYTENLYAGFWRFNERWVRRKHHVTTKIGIKAGERVFCYSAKRLSNALKVVGKKAHLYICRQSDGDGFLLVLSERCGIVLVPGLKPESYKDISMVAEPLRTGVDVPEGNLDRFLDGLSDLEAERQIRRLSVELGILHM